MRYFMIFLIILVLMGCAKEPECYSEEINHTVVEEGLLSYEIMTMYKYTDPKDSGIAGAVVQVKNTDVREGEFVVELTFTLPNQIIRIINVSNTIQPNQTIDFRGEVPSDTLEEEAIELSGRVIAPIGPSVHRTEIKEICE